MVRIRIDDHALEQMARLPSRMQTRIESVVDRLENWPEVSGVKALTGNLKGRYRIRSGDYRVLFKIEPDLITITNIDHRKDVYR